VLLTRVRARSRGEPASRDSVLGDLRAGWREVRSRAWVWVTIAAFTGAVLCVYAQWYALAPSIARAVYGSASVFGLLEAAVGAGAVAGAVVGIRWRPEHPLFAGLLLVLAWPLLDAGFALAAPLAVVVGLAVTTGFGFSLMGIWWETALARNIPAAALSRVSAWDWMGSLALLPVGYVLAGPLAQEFGARTVLGVGSAIGLGLLLLALLPQSTRELGERDASAGHERSPALGAQRL